MIVHELSGHRTEPVSVLQPKSPLTLQVSAIEATFEARAIPPIVLGNLALPARLSARSRTITLPSVVVLKLRALVTNGDFDEYWRFHETMEQERNRTHALAVNDNVEASNLRAVG